MIATRNGKHADGVQDCTKHKVCGLKTGPDDRKTDQMNEDEGDGCGVDDVILIGVTRGIRERHLSYIPFFVCCDWICRRNSGLSRSGLMLIAFLNDSLAKSGPAFLGVGNPQIAMCFGTIGIDADSPFECLNH